MVAVKEIPLSRHGLVAIVDADDFRAMSAFQWQAVRKKNTAGATFYAARHATAADGGGWIQMHRVLAGAAPGVLVDHKNGDTLDNRRSNLRCCTNRQNCQNQTRPKRRGKSSRFKGVYLDKRRGTWVARIRAGAVDARGAARKLTLGEFHNEDDAARAYDAAAREHFGSFAATNF